VRTQTPRPPLYHQTSRKRQKSRSEISEMCHWHPSVRGNFYIDPPGILDWANGRAIDACLIIAHLISGSG
jgi:hypothetical protein